MGDSLTVQHYLLHLEPAKGLAHGQELSGPVPPVAAPEAHLVVGFAGDDPVAVVLDLVSQSGPLGTVSERVG